MTKRVSIKGRGADLFFGEYEPENVVPMPIASPPEEAIDPVPEEPGTDASGQAEPSTAAPSIPSATDQKSDTQARMHARKQESKKARMHASNGVAAEDAELPPNLPIEVWDLVAEQATITNAFRYTDHDLTTLADVLYDITKRHRVKISKQDVARLGLNVVLLDYQQRGDASLLGELARRKKRPRGTGE
jgi:hypothetical protein